jgi:GTP-dependent phosphoenolpyruvate carboxykinase
MEDPVIQQRERELDIREQDVQRKMKADAEKIATDIKKIESQEKIAGAKIGADLITDKESITSQEKIAGAKIGKDVAETLLDIDSKKKR